MKARSSVVLLSIFFAFSAVAAVDIPVSDAVLGNPPDYRDAFVLGTDGDGFLAAWIDRRSFEPMLFAARLTSSGEVLDPTGIPLDRGPVGRPQVIWNGERYLVFWTWGGLLVVAPVNRDGTTGVAHEAAFGAVSSLTVARSSAPSTASRRGSVSLSPRAFLRTSRA